MLHLPTGIGGCIDDVNRLRDGFVEDALRSHGVIDHATRATTAEIREERDQRKAVIWTPIVVQDGISGRYRPTHALHATFGDNRPGLTELFEHFRRFIAGQLPEVAAREHRHGHDFAHPLLPIDDANPFHVVAAVLAVARCSRLQSELGAFLAVVVLFAEIAVAGIERRFFGFQANFNAVQSFDLVERQPARDNHIGPRGRVVALGVRIRDHVERVKHRNVQFALFAVVEVHPNVVVAPLLNHAVLEDFRLFPVQFVVAGDLHRHF